MVILASSRLYRFLSKFNFLLISFTLFCFYQNSYAICVKNETGFNLSYEIQNLNTDRCPPKVKYYQGTLAKDQKNCHAHTSEDPDWTIYRKDLIKVYKLNNDGSKAKQVCHKIVNGILNTLEVSYLEDSNTWWCLDRSDYED